MRLPGQIFKDGLSKPLGIVRLGPVEVRSKWLHDYRPKQACGSPHSGSNWNEFLGQCCWSAKFRRHLVGTETSILPILTMVFARAFAPLLRSADGVS